MYYLIGDWRGLLCTAACWCLPLNSLAGAAGLAGARQRSLRGPILSEEHSNRSLVYSTRNSFRLRGGIPKVAHKYRIVAAVSGRPTDRPHTACHGVSRSVTSESRAELIGATLSLWGDDCMWYL